MTEPAVGTRSSPGDRLVRWGSWAGLAVAVILAIFSFDGDSPEAWSKALGYGSLVAAPFGLALLASGLRGVGKREAVYLACGLVALGTGVLSFSGLAVIGPPAIAVLIGAVRGLAARRVRVLRPGFLGLFAFVFLTWVAALWALLLRADPRCHPISTTGVSCASDVITWIEAAISLSIWAFAYAVIAAALAGDRRERIGARPEPIRPRSPGAGGAQGNGKTHVAGEAKS